LMVILPFFIFHVKTKQPTVVILIFRFGIRQSNGPLNRIDMFTIPYNLDLNSFLFWCYFLQFYGVSYF
jgi:hypothetical protein